MEKIIEIAVIVAGIDEEYQHSVIEGVINCAKVNNANISCFSAFGGVISNSKYDVGEYNIYSLINFEKFDGVILLSNTISDPIEKEKIVNRVKKSGLPVSILDCSDYKDFYNISIDNYSVMRTLVSHVILAHGAKIINYISGPVANPEAADRQRAFSEVMKEYSLEVDEERIYHGDFRAADGKKAIEYFFSSALEHPQAIICANDAMALAAIEELNNMGYKVPDDVIVTGFDNTYNAKHHLPALTTVSRPLDEAGYKACEVILKVIKGKKQKGNITLKSSPVFTESCGCKTAEKIDIDEYKITTYKMLNSFKNDISLLNRMTAQLVENETPEENFRTVASLIHEVQCERFAICLCSNWDQVITGKSSDEMPEIYQIQGYTEKMSAPLLMMNGRNHPVTAFDSSDMLPMPVSGGGNVSFFMPLHFRERCLGYYVFMNSTFPLKSLLCHALMLSISNSIENICKILHLNSMIDELNKLYTVDQLCNIYNRNGFIRMAGQIYNSCQNAGRKVLISFIDMDGLKYINDNFGHKEGDYALQHLARIIKDCCKSGRICARFGGDEFIILGANATDEDIPALESTFNIQLESINRIIRKPYKISASIGTIVTDATADVTLFNLITQADEIMYENKKRKRTSRYLRRDHDQDDMNYDTRWNYKA
ncbi:GGDEF domain-containing protein [Ruminococcus sp.]|uniref:substrate-binding and GGDEF domain-containing protein n=1 Tax=Ruminococcus sp. TaxID=41978 RepID=UPI0025CD6DAE|nr:GGDEF domain-containing protein [Ruminococcus sp.]